MKSYYNLIKELAPLDRCHCGPEMEYAYDILTEHYKGSRKLKYQCGENIHHWIIPPYWECKKAILKDSDGNIIADKSRNNLEVFSYSPPYKGDISLKNLDDHLISDPERPDSIIFHFRNQYRHWSPVWGFSIPDKIRRSLKDELYYVEIESSFDNSKKMIQADFSHSGENEKEFLFMGHFDHPSMVNDGLAGSIAAFEIINRLKGRKTYNSYRAFASVEIIGSVAYLAKEKNIVKNLNEALFLSFSGINSELSYQQSYKRKSTLDRIVKYLLSFNIKYNEDYIFSHREVVGNDENVFDSVGYEIPTGTLFRTPFPEYHTNKDNISITSNEKIEEMIGFGLKIIDVLENDYFVTANYNGLPCLSNSEIDLYIEPKIMSNLISNDQLSKIDIDRRIYSNELNYLEDHQEILNQFMQNVVRMADGHNTIFDICEKSKIPFFFGLAYLKKMEEKKIVSLNK